MPKGTVIHSDSNGVDVIAIGEVMGVNHAGHSYQVVDKEGNVLADVRFQMGPVKEVGVNGVTNEALLAILIDRTGFINRQFSCKENDRAIEHLEDALAQFEVRTARRQKRGVEGRNIA